MLPAFAGHALSFEFPARRQPTYVRGSQSRPHSPLPLTYPRCTTPISHRGDTPHRRARQQVRCRHFQQTGERHLLVSHFILPSFLRRVLLNQISFYPSLPFPSRCRVCRAGCGHNDQGQEINRGKKDTAAKCLRYVRRVRQIHVRNKKITPS